MSAVGGKADLTRSLGRSPAMAILAPNLGRCGRLQPMRRREFIKFIGGAAAVWPLAVSAQQPKRLPRLGVLLFAEQDRTFIKPCLDELRALGYVDGKSIIIDYRDADARYDRLPELAAQLVNLAPDAIFSFGGEQAPIVKRATASIPIVVVVSNDPVASGLVKSLAQPGGNVTGLTYVHDQLAGKVIEALKNAVPLVSRVAVLWNPDHTDPEFRETQRVAPALGVQLQSLEVRGAGDLEGAFQSAMRERAEALIVIGARILALHQQQIGDFAAKNRLVLVGTPKWLLGAGALLTYGPDPVVLFRRAASYVDKVLKGTKPADLPMEQPTKYELAINLKTAKVLGLAIPPQLLAIADEVID
jgi:putative tryptophan/tyrosine transport system substrate-binding protein